MPSLASIRDYILPVAAPLIGGAINRRAAGNATTALTGGANAAMGTIQAGADRAAAGIQAGSDRAAGTIQGGADQASRTLADVYAQQRKDLDPFRTAGTGALDSLSKGTAEGGEFNRPFSMADFELYRDPMFNWRVQQGERAIKAGANSGGIRFSGATLKALSDYNSKATMAEEANAYGRYQDDLQGRFNRAADVAGASQNAANQTVNAGGTYGANLANLQTGTSRSLADLQSGTARGLADIQRGTADQIAGLQTDLASAQAAGDVAKAGTITDTINSILQGVDNVGTARSLAALARGAAPVAGAVGAALPAASAALPAGFLTAAGTLAPEGAATLAGLGGIANSVGPGTAAYGAAFGAPGATTGAGGISGALGLGGGSGMFGLGALTIPVLGAGIAAAAYFVPKLFGDKKAQAAANLLTGAGGVHDEIRNGINAIDAAQELDPQQKVEAKEALARKIEDELVQFAKKDKHHYYKAKATLQDFARWGFGVRPLLG